MAIVDTGVDALTPNFRGRVATGLQRPDQRHRQRRHGRPPDNGHGTLVAGVIAQFVPQATLDPVNVFTPNQVVTAPGGDRRHDRRQRHHAAEHLQRPGLRRQEPVRQRPGPARTRSTA